VLVLEENDIQLTNERVVAGALFHSEAGMTDRPDEVYLVSSAVRSSWWSFALRIDDRNYDELSGAEEDPREIDPDTLVDLTAMGS
jgi:hypothetical protein